MEQDSSRLGGHSTSNQAHSSCGNAEGGLVHEQWRRNVLSTEPLQPKPGCAPHKQQNASSEESRQAPSIPSRDSSSRAAEKHGGGPLLNDEVLILGEYEDANARSTPASCPSGSRVAADLDIISIADCRQHQAAMEGLPRSSASAILQSSKTVSCPCCGRQWLEHEISNDRLNRHVDDCLNPLAVGAMGVM